MCVDNGGDYGDEHNDSDDDGNGSHHSDCGNIGGGGEGNTDGGGNGNAISVGDHVCNSTVHL